MILFTDKEHSWKVRPIKFDFSGVTDPLPMEMAIFESKDEWSWIEVDDILKRTNTMDEDVKTCTNFYEIVETMRTMETLHKMINLYRSGGSHISIDLSDEVKAIEMLELWIKFANLYNELIGASDKVVMTKQLVMKIARETKPTLFAMPNSERFYNDKKSVIVQLSPYEDNTKALKEKQLSKDYVKLPNRLEKILEAIQE